MKNTYAQRAMQRAANERAAQRTDAPVAKKRTISIATLYILTLAIPTALQAIYHYTH